MANVAKESTGVAGQSETFPVDEVFADLLADEAPVSSSQDYDAPLVRRSQLKVERRQIQIEIPPAVQVVGLTAIEPIVVESLEQNQSKPVTPVPPLPAPVLTVEVPKARLPEHDPDEIEFLRERIPQLEDRIAELLEKNSEVKRSLGERDVTIEQLRQERKLDAAQAKRERETWELRLQELTRQLEEAQHRVADVSVSNASVVKNIIECENDHQLIVCGDGVEDDLEELDALTQRMLLLYDDDRRTPSLPKIVIVSAIALAAAGASVAYWYFTR